MLRCTQPPRLPCYTAPPREVRLTEHGLRGHPVAAAGNQGCGGSHLADHHAHIMCRLASPNHHHALALRRQGERRGPRYGWKHEWAAAGVPQPPSGRGSLDGGRSCLGQLPAPASSLIVSPPARPAIQLSSQPAGSWLPTCATEASVKSLASTTQGPAAGCCACTSPSAHSGRSGLLKSPVATTTKSKA